MNAKKINWKRCGLALIGGLFVSSIAMGFIHAWSGYPVGRFFMSLEDFPTLALMYFIIEVLTAMIVVVPTLTILNRLLWLKRSIVLIIGTLLGAGWAIPMLGPQPPPYLQALFFAFGGFLASSVFWLLYAGANKQLKHDAQKARAS